jgi:hypothetical protein
MQILDPTMRAFSYSILKLVEMLKELMKIVTCTMFYADSGSNHVSILLLHTEVG